MTLRRGVLAATLILLICGQARAEELKDGARSTLDRWLDAQNSGNFDAYQSLYAREFVGVKRSRTRTTSFDRAGWLEDRERMFKKRMTVQATNVRVLAKTKSALVVFTQRWASGSYADVGPKHLVLRRLPAGWRIVREELFASNRDATGGVDVAAFQRFAFVLDGEVVVSTDPDDGWASGPAKQDGKVGKNFVLRSKRPVDLKKLPAELVALKGAPLHLFDGTGARCDAKLGAFLLRGRVISGTDAEGDFDDAGDGGWAMSNHFLVAKIIGDRKACAKATWARAASLPLPTVAAATAPTSDFDRLAWGAFEELPESRVIQRRFDAWSRAHHAKVGTPWFRTAGARPTVHLIRPPKGPALLSVVAKATLGDGDTCGGDGLAGSLWGLWEITGPDDAPSLVLRNHPDEALVLELIGAVDVDGDGHAELLFDGFQDPATTNIFGQGGEVLHGLIRALGGVYVDVAAPETPVLICPC